MTANNINIEIEAITTKLEDCEDAEQRQDLTAELEALKADLESETADASELDFSLFTGDAGDDDSDEFDDDCEDEQYMPVFCGDTYDEENI